MNWIERKIQEAAEQKLTELDLSVPWRMSRKEKDSADVLTELPRSLLQLTWLRKLDLTGHSLTALPQEIGALEHLTHLDMDGNSGCDVASAIAGLTRLRELALPGLGAERINAIDFQRLPELESIWLANNQLHRVPPTLLGLPLIRIDLGFNRLDEFPSELETFTGLRSLDFGRTSYDERDKEQPVTARALRRLAKRVALKELNLIGPYSLPVLEAIGEFESLEKLSFFEVKLADLPQTWTRLRELKSFSVYDTGKTQFNLEPCLAAWQALEELSVDTPLSSRALSIIGDSTTLRTLALEKLTGFPSQILSLSQLESLSLPDCQITEVSADLRQLPKLSHLDLGGNPLTRMPERVESLQLQVLWLRGTRITDFSILRKLTTLKGLSLGDVPLGRFPEAILDLNKLEELRLRDTGITTIPSAIGQLTRLEHVDLSNNQIQLIPRELVLLPRLQDLDLSGNPALESPPPEIVSRGTAAIQDYFAALDPSHTTRLFEAKLVIVGEGRVGKTCLARKLLDRSYDVTQHKDDDTTRGIEIRGWRIQTDVASDFKVNVWDFGGQEIYHATHQFFLTERSLYLFVWDAQKEDRLEGFDYWLNVVKLLSRGSPVVVVLNKADVRTREIDQESIRKRFPNIVGFHRVSALNAQGFNDLERQIRMRISTLPHMGTTWPKSWTNVREALERDPRNYIDRDQFLAICAAESLQEGQALALSRYLHDLGVVLHFQDDPVLGNTVILKPSWGTGAVYAVLDAAVVRDQRGQFSFSDLAQIWDTSRYPRAKHIDLLRLMTRFELCFELEGTQRYIVPELLPASPPPAIALNDPRALRFEYHYDFMPSGLVTRFIARNHSFIDGSGYWRNGVRLVWEGAKALVVSEPLRRRITVAVTGSDPRTLLAMIRRDLAHIHATLNNPEVREMIPCICSHCRTEGNEPELMRYRFLKAQEQGQIPEVVCERSGERVSLKELLSGIGPISDRPTTQRGAVEGGTVLHIEKVENLYTQPGESMTAQRKPAKGRSDMTPSLWVNGGFYLVAFAVIIALLAVVARSISVWLLPIILIGGLVAVSVIGALELRRSGKLSQNNFLQLMALTFRQLPLLRRFWQNEAAGE